MLDDVRMAARFVRALPGYLRRPLTPEECRARLTRQLEQREASFLSILERGVFGNARSPYLALLRQAGIKHGDLAASVRQHGVERTLGELYDAGVYVTLDEFKGRRPMRRLGLDLRVSDRDFDNSLMTAHYEARTGGSRGVGGVGRRVTVDLGLLAHEAAYDFVFLSALDALKRPMAMWRPVPPAGAGIKILLRHAKIGLLFERWFSQTESKLSRENARYHLFIRAAVALSRLCGRPLPRPEHTPLEQTVTVARWLAQKTAQGTPAYLEANAGATVRACLAAREHGLDISGTLFRIGGEAFTEARARIIAESSARALCHYNMDEIGRLGVACAEPVALDDVHVAVDKVALLQRERHFGPGEPSVGALFCTTLHSAAPKIMLNVEVGDYGVLSERACGCSFGALGFTYHLHGIRSYEKLTSEGMQFTGGELLRLIEEVLPARFGGHPTDYQLVEEEEGGLSRVSILVSPRLGHVDETQVVATALDVLGFSSNANRMMARYWRDAQTLRVVKREPYLTHAAKILPLHVIRRTERPAP
jgi:hypothetical protein